MSLVGIVSRLVIVDCKPPIMTNDQLITGEIHLGFHIDRAHSPCPEQPRESISNIHAFVRRIAELRGWVQSQLVELSFAGSSRADVRR